MNRIYNWKKDKEDLRDFKYEITHKVSITNIPKSIDLSTSCSPVFDQGQIGSCTGNALAGMYEYLQLKYLKDTTIKTAEEFTTKYDPVSRLFIYYYERSLEGTVGEDSGAQIRDGIKVLASQGVCREINWPYSQNNLFKKPNKNANSEAVNHKISVYSRINNLNDMKNCLASGFPFVFGFMVYDYFETEEMAKNGILQMPKSNEACLGGHAVMAAGYDDKTQMILVRNSWGAAWGKKGYFYMPYTYISNSGLASDFWSVRK